MEITLDLVKQLRDKTGAGVMEAKNILKEAEGDLVKAVELMRKRGQKIAAKKAEREAGEGIVGSYVHNTGKIASMVKVYCETDFVAKNDELKELAKDIAMQVVAMNPKYVKPEDVPQEILEKEKEIYAEQLKSEGKPAEVAEKIMKGKLDKYFESVCLLKQRFFKDDSRTIEELVNEKIAKLGENIQIGEFVKFDI